MSITIENIEIWRACVVSFGEILENYKVSNFGNFKNVKTGVLLSGYTPKSGYMRIKLKNKNKDYVYYTASRVIYASFNPLENIEGFDVEIIDGDKTNLKLNNLKKSTREESSRNEKQPLRSNTTNHKNICISKTKSGRLVYSVELYKKGEPRKSKKFNNIDDALIFRDQRAEELRN
jgi:hypothetical protein